jgi:two-component system, NtrC family, response regulator HydG
VKARILLVDDDADYLDSTKDVLEEEGYEVVTAGSGEEAVRAAERRRFDVAVMDIKMPGLNGVEAFIEMKKRDPRVRCIMCTAYIVESLIRQALQEGVYAVLNKPFEIEALLKMIEDASKRVNAGVVLLADRDEVFCERMAAGLRREGYTVVTAHNGEQALIAAQGRQIDVLMLELNLPILNGFEVYRRVRAFQPDILGGMILGFMHEVDTDLRLRLRAETGLTLLTKPLDVLQALDLLDSFTAAGRM